MSPKMHPVKFYSVDADQPLNSDLGIRYRVSGMGSQQQGTMVAGFGSLFIDPYQEARIQRPKAPAPEH